MTEQKLHKFSRRRILKILGFTGSGLLLTLVGKTLFTKLSSNSNEVVTVDVSGNIINREALNAKYFTEDLGNGVTLEMAEIPGGEFLMGSPEDEKGRNDNENPQHKVNIKPFFMGKFAVTQAQYQEIMGKNPSNYEGNKHPVDNLFWDDANKFCQKLTEKTGRTYRLPSEAEWEYACRAGTTTPFHFGETITTDLANFNGNRSYADAPKGEYREQTTEVGNFPPNAFGLYDMHGNLWEWCQDTWHENYNGAPDDGSAWVDIGNNIADSMRSNYERVLRGGSWIENSSFCRSAYRRLEKPLAHIGNFGFRVVCNSAPQAV